MNKVTQQSVRTQKTLLNYLDGRKVSIAVYLRNYIKKLTSQSEQNDQLEFLKQMTKYLYEALVSPNIEYVVKKHLALIFEYILMIY